MLVEARAALFDVYGDHLRPRGGVAPVAALVRLLAPLDIAAPAVRTAISRMVRQGWLLRARLPEGPAYALAPRAVRRLDDAAARIYSAPPPWDGRWHVVHVRRPDDRQARARLRQALGFLGYAPLGEDTWVAPRESPELREVVEAEAAQVRAFTASFEGSSADLLAQAWDLDELGDAYRSWLADARELTGTSPGASAVAVRDTPASGASEGGDEQAFALRSRLLHEWRKFLFRDPGLPLELLPESWPGREARQYFDAEAARLLPAASRFVDRCLAGLRPGEELEEPA